MTITVDTTRPKANTNSAIALNLAVGSILENDTNDSFFIPVNATNLTIPDYTVIGVTTENGSDVLTVTQNGFIDVRVGDAIAAGTNIGAVTVVSKTDNNTITVSENATGDGTENLTFSPSGGGEVDLTLVGVKVAIAPTVGGKLTVVFTGYVYDGSLKGSPGTDLNATRQINLNRLDIDLDSVLATARIPRTN